MDKASTDPLRRGLALAGKLIDEGERVFDLATAAPDKVHPGDFQPLLGLLAKAFYTFEAVVMLCEKGLSNEALGLQRALLEAVVHFKLITEHSQQTAARSERYVTFARLAALKFARSVTSCATLSHFKAAIESSDFSIDDEEASLKRTLGDEYKTFKKADHWWGKGGNLREACKHLGLEADYVICARLGSRALHATDYDEYVDRRDSEGSTAFSPGESGKWAKGVLASSCRLFAILLVSANVCFELGRDAEVKLLRDEAERHARGG